MTTPVISELDRHAQPNEGHVELKVETRDQRRARLASILDRGVVHDRLHVKLPSHMYGEWVRNNPLDVDSMRTLGFHIDEEYSTKRNIHSDGTSANKVADVIFMVCEKEVKEDIDYVRAQTAERANNPRRASKEETEFRQAADPEIQPTTNSSTRSVTLNEALTKVNNQTSPIK
jgi:hypothetical protein